MDATIRTAVSTRPSTRIASTKWALGILLATLGISVATLALPSEAAPKAKVPTHRGGNPISGWGWLDQHWTADVRQNFYLTSQGSELMPYDWFLAIEQTGSQAPFVQSMDRYGFLPGPVATANPDHLPLGFVSDETPTTLNGTPRTFNGLTIKKWVGLTCAACHTGAITYTKSAGETPVKLILDGAPSNGDYGAFFSDLADTIAATNEDDNAFDRFAHNVLKTGYTASKAAQLRTQFKLFAADFARMSRGIASPSITWGPGRVDAFGVIFNKVAYFAINRPENLRTPNAPVNFPFLWNIARQDHLQWFGEVPNKTIVDRLGRNAGEVMGVFARLNINPKSFWYDSTVKRVNLLRLEHWVGTLSAPKWPEDKLGPIDQEKAARGAKLYKQYCTNSRCHPPLGDGKSLIKITPIPLGEIQTDAVATQNIHTSKVNTGGLEGKWKLLPFGPKLGATATAGELLGHEGFYALINPGFSVPEVSALAGMGVSVSLLLNKNELAQGSVLSDTHPTEGYEARPLNGIWASAPYLHNGSVPSLYQLLLPPDQRIKTFHYGTYEFDPVNVGYQTDASYGGKVFDTSLTGNTNTGHNCLPPTTSDSDRWDLVEYLKTL